MSHLISIKEATETLRVSRSTVDRLIREGVLSTVAIGRRRLITSQSLRALAEPESVH